MNLRVKGIWRIAIPGFVVGAALISPAVGRCAVVLAVFGLIVAIHELGHLLAGRAVGIRIKRFAVFLGPPIVTWTWKETVMTIGLIPLGGYVEATDETSDGSEPAQDPHRHKVWWRELAFSAGGPAATLIAGVFGLLLMTGEVFSDPSHIRRSWEMPPVVEFIGTDSPASKAGLMVGDRIISFNGERIRWAMDFTAAKDNSPYWDHKLVIIRDGTEMQLSARCWPGDAFGVYFSEFEGLPSLLKIYSPIGLISTGCEWASRGWFVLLAFFLCVNFLVLLTNILPIPPLDGWCIVLALLEGIRMEPSRAIRQGLNAAGVLFLLALMILSLVWDVMALI